MYSACCRLRLFRWGVGISVCGDPGGFGCDGQIGTTIAGGSDAVLKKQITDRVHKDDQTLSAIITLHQAERLEPALLQASRVLHPYSTSPTVSDARLRLSGTYTYEP
jgi:hypothetical protein